MKLFTLGAALIFCLTINAQFDTYTHITCQREPIFLTGIPDCAEGEYYLVFEDNFDGEELDLTKWNPVTGVPRDFSFQDQKAWHQPENLIVSNGTLKIVANKPDVPYSGTYVTDWSTNPPTTTTTDFNYTTGEISTIEKFYYGKYEIRCQLPAGKGFWPAFWTYASDPWNEIDIFEMKGNNIDRYTCNLHRDVYNNGGNESCVYAIEDVADFTDWHTFTCIFEQDRVVWLIDNIPVRTYARYLTISYDNVFCDDEIANGTYLASKLFPTHPMSIFVNLAIESGSDAPDITTIFPNNYEIDYVRFYAKGDPPCDGCLDHISYENLDNLPIMTRATEYIYAGEDVTVQTGQDVEFKAPDIKFTQGFTSELGSNLIAKPQQCNLTTVAGSDVEIEYVGDNAPNDIITKCVEPLYSIEAVGAQYYYFTALNSENLTEHTISGKPTANTIDLWNTENVPDGPYFVNLHLINCSDHEIMQYTLWIQQGNCRIESSSNLKSVETDKTSANDDLVVYPNPVNDVLNVFFSSENEEQVFMRVFDLNGKELIEDRSTCNQGANRVQVSTKDLSNGSYKFVLEYGQTKHETTFIVSR